MRLKPVVLAIDDDLIFRRAIESVLSRFGVTIVGTSQVEEFLRSADKLDPDLFLIDLQLTETTGFELIQKLRVSHPKAIIVVISGASDSKSMTHALEVGANDFILKPLDRVLLASKLSRYLDTEELRENRANFIELPEGQIPARLTLDVEIDEIDELGLQMLSPHLIPKGTVLKIKSDLWKQLGLTDGECLVSVSSTSFLSEQNLYRAAVDFETDSSEFLEALRRWLSETP